LTCLFESAGRENAQYPLSEHLSVGYSIRVSSSMSTARRKLVRERYWRETPIYRNARWLRTGLRVNFFLVTTDNASLELNCMKERTRRHRVIPADTSRIVHDTCSKLQHFPATVQPGLCILGGKVCSPSVSAEIPSVRDPASGVVVRGIVSPSFVL